MLFLHKHIEELGPLADATLQQLGLASKSVVCVPAEMATIKAFATMVVSALAPASNIAQSFVMLPGRCTGSPYQYQLLL